MPKSKEKKIWRLWPAFIENAHDVGIGIVWPGVEPVHESTCLDFNLLHSAAQQPYQEVFGRELYPTLAAKAAYLFVHIAGSQIFTNGNKRTAVLCVDTFLLANSRYLVLTNQQTYELACYVASSGEHGIKFDDMRASVTELLEKNSPPLSVLRKIDSAEYRNALHYKNWIRNSPLNQPDAPLSQHERT